ncbi:HD-GYP domain-containing protein [Hathewaya limosa]|uniref:HD-GYP domain-containing protein (C-di-GMP phosphodiesterase class II) n=1 Tax=Hathewaya limosa TaxID=1536 RepID=A0ABU0JUA4_HATLI|nr:HD-GYP domain-containing protein [Hathewaya limosa]MDQ0479980.1 HD-GYP domain-containing protein (c-di-GMP phosphodiesterase class II) [Hathewaya limosa]
MNSKEWVLVKTKDLQEGMIVAKDIFNEKAKLITKDLKLNNKLIKKIQYIFPFGKIEIYKHSVPNALEICAKEISTKKLEKVEQVFEDISSNVDQMLSYITINTKPKLNNIKEISSNILEEVNDYTYALKTITNEREIDEYLVRHSANVAVLASILGRWLNFSDREITLLSHAGLLHDIGKTKIDPKILNKPAKLTKEEFEIVKKHPVLGYDLLKDLPYISPLVSNAVLMHHERIDGSGYPLGIKNDKITNLAKIISIVDIFDAMTSNKSYSNKVSPFKALEVLQKEYINKLDPIYLTTFIEKVGDYFTGELIVLNTGHIGKIIKTNIYDISRPLILVDEQFIDLSKTTELYIEDLYIEEVYSKN